MAGEARERLYGEMQGFKTLLVEPGFWAEALHVWDTNAPAGSEEQWHEVAVFPLAATATPA